MEIQHVPQPGDWYQRGRYVETEAGYSAFGQLCAKVLKELAGYANFVEISNEPNGTPQTDGTAIPAVHYGAMCAYAAYWIDLCLQPPNYERAYALGGALTTRGNWKQYTGAFMSEFYRRCQIFYPVASAPIEFGRLTKSLRLSIHPYPDFEENAATGLPRVWLTLQV